MPCRLPAWNFPTQTNTCVHGQRRICPIRSSSPCYPSSLHSLRVAHYRDSPRRKLPGEPTTSRKGDCQRRTDGSRSVQGRCGLASSVARTVGKVAGGHASSSGCRESSASSWFGVTRSACCLISLVTASLSYLQRALSLVRASDVEAIHCISCPTPTCPSIGSF